MPDGSELLRLAERFVASCPAPALVVEAGGRVRSANPAAAKLLGLAPGAVDPPLRELLGVGWREVEMMAGERGSDLVAELPRRAALAGPHGALVRIEPVDAPDGGLGGVIAFLDPVPGVTAAGRPPRRRAQGFDALFGTDAALTATKAAGARFAQTLLPVLLIAETGTGKELLAHAIHDASARRDQPFVAINCGALSPHLLESELFGYAPGAFTGASRDGNEGKIGAARGGSLFLDEVAEMPAPLQALLLRVLEDGTYYRVGDNRPRQADVRLICATCRDLPALVANGRFREDLYYRVNGACLTLPPVRQRSDLPALIQHLLETLAREQGQRTPTLSGELLPRLLALPWPGNVRQLRTVLQYALILSEGETIRAEHLPRDLAEHLEAVAQPAEEQDRPVAVRADVQPPARAPRTLAERERERLESAVERAGGNLSRAATALGIARSTLYRRLRRHGLLP
jgi:transcriptional regulator with PAS, ATPase and Fis domain